MSATTPLWHSRTALLAAFGAVAGCAVYVALPMEPTLTEAFALSILGLGLAVLAYTWGRGAIAAMPFAWACAFLAWAVAHSAWVATPLMPAELSGQRLWVTGVVRQVDLRDRTTRLDLPNATVYGPEGAVTTGVRLSVDKKRGAGVAPGDRISAQAQLQRPEAAAFPGDYDAARYGFLEGWGARGFVMGDFYVTPAVADQPQGWRTHLEAFRAQLTAALKGNGSDAGAVAAAMITGDRAAVSPALAQAYQASGLGHLMAISGMNLALVAGFVFFAVRLMWASVPWLAVRVDGRVPAAALGFVAAAGYALVAGASVPTIRAALMIGFALVALVLGRLAQGVRGLAVAALLVLAVWPLAVASPSFQMSFGAVLALMLWTAARQDAPAAGYLATVAWTSVVAGLATAPLAVWHFDRLSLVGFAANLVGVPLMGVVIMPLALVALAGLAVGWTAPVGWYQASTGVLNQVAVYASATPYASVAVTPDHAWLVAAGAWGALVLVLMKRARWALAVLAVTLATLAYWSHGEHPTLYALRHGNTVLLKDGGPWVLLKGDGSAEEKQLLKRLKVAGTAVCPTGCVWPLGDRLVWVGDPPDGDTCAAVDGAVGQKSLPTSCEKSAVWGPQDTALMVTPFGVTAHRPPVGRPWGP